MNRRQVVGLSSAIAGAAMLLGSMIGPVRAAAGDEEGHSQKVTICHAAGLDGTTHYNTLTIGWNAVYGPAGHFFENGTPRAGHEDDYLGECREDTTTTAAVTTTTAEVTTTTAEAEEDKVGICHATSSETNPYEAIEVPYSAIDGEGENDHSHHTGPVFYEGAKDDKVDWGDIIPPVPGVIPDGLNWTDEGQAIWENECEPVSEVTTTTAEATTTTAEVTTTSVESEGPTTTSQATTTSVESEAVTTTTQVGGESGALPGTGSGGSLGLTLGGATLLGMGTTMMFLARRRPAM